MRTITQFPHPVRELEHIEIPLADGCRLAARIWLPEDAENAPVPAILEYLPYRKNDLTAERDALAHPYFAGHGYAGVRVDMRGSGESDGVLTDEYLPQELDDGVEVLRWIAAQPWCDGNIGMMGISWGGFNGLQIAALAPSELKAVLTLSSTDDRYADDVHYMGGSLLIDNLSWASIMFGRNTLPPDPRLVGERWRELWQQRLQGSGLWLDNWLQHQYRDGFWRHASVCEDFSAIRCPVYAVGGWADGYCNAVFRLLAGLDVPRKGLIGPWSHAYPYIATPGPAIGFLQEALRWWDHWLKGRDSGIMDEPMLRVWMQDSAPPQVAYATRPGRWVAEPGWPSSNVQPTAFALCADHTLAPAGDAGAVRPLTVRSPLSVGFAGGKWCSYGHPPDLPVDQREDDGGSLVFDSEPLAAALEMLGQAKVELDLSADQPVAQVAARLSDVAPDGSVTRICYGLLNLTHRDSHEQPQPLEPGRRYRVQIGLKHVAQRFAPGHRLRLALSSSYWPLAWPTPRPAALTVYTGSSRLQLPLRAPLAADDELAPFAEPEAAPPLATTTVAPGAAEWRVVHDLLGDEHTLEVIDDGGTWRIDGNGLEVSMRGLERYRYQGDDYASVRGETEWIIGLRRGDWAVQTTTRTVLTSDAEAFHIEADLVASEGEKEGYRQQWVRHIPRQLL